MFAHGFRQIALGKRQVEQTRNLRHVYSGRAGRAMAAIHAMAFPAYARKTGQGFCIIALGRCGIGIIKACLNFLNAVGASKHTGYARPIQSVGNALVNG